jgi:hypothetical protein
MRLRIIYIKITFNFFKPIIIVLIIFMNNLKILIQLIFTIFIKLIKKIRIKNHIVLKEMHTYFLKHFIKRKIFL